MGRKPKYKKNSVFNSARRLSLWEKLVILYFIVLLVVVWYIGINSSMVPRKRALKTRNEEEGPLYVLKVGLFGYERLDSLKYLWERVKKTDFSMVDDVRIDIEFYIDGQKMKDLNNKFQEDLTRFLRGLTWDKGHITVHRSFENIGLKASILTAWYPLKRNEFMVFFEDDIDVSIHWFRWIDTAIRKYYTFQGAVKKNFFGVSLYNQKFHEITWRKFQFNNGYKPYLFQMPMSWGACYFPLEWRRFRDWYYVSNVSYFNATSIQKSHSNRWTLKTSWKRFATYYFYSHKGYMLYPNLPYKTSFSTQRGIPGTHSRRRTAFRYIIPLLTDIEQFKRDNDDTDDPFDLPEWNELRYLNIYAKRESHPFLVHTPAQHLVSRTGFVRCQLRKIYQYLFK